MNVAVLIATKDRTELLLDRAVSAVLRQTRLPHTLVIVNDGSVLDTATRTSLESLAAAAGIELILLRNARAPGAGGAWNTGLAHLSSHGHRGFVAILDDDDHWDTDHVEANLALADGATIVVSGLRMVLEGRPLDRPLIEHLDPRAFLTGNPGWQGSNTFVELDLLLQAGGFREGLLSLNDRDLAVRLLRHPRAVWRLTGRWTATWYAGTPGNLSEPRSRGKRQGFQAFWMLYGHEMGSEERAGFFRRAEQLFGITPEEIVCEEFGTPPPLGFPWRVSHA